MSKDKQKMKIIEKDLPEENASEPAKTKIGFMKSLVGIVAALIVLVGPMVTIIIVNQHKKTNPPEGGEKVAVVFNIDTGGSSIEPDNATVGVKIQDIVPKEVEGYKFFGWYKDAEYTKMYAPGDVLTDESEIFGLYLIAYNVTFPEEMVGYTIIADDTVAGQGLDYEFKVQLQEGYTKSNFKVYLVIGENKTELNRTANGKYIVPNVTSDFAIEVAGVTANTYSVSFLDGGRRVKQETVTHNQYASASGIETTEREFYEFIGWGIKENDDSVVNLNTYEIKGDTVFYAKYKQLEYAVKFMKEGTELSQWTFNAKAGEYLPSDMVAPGTQIKPATLAKEYRFEGWSLTEDGNIVTDFSTIRVTGPIIFCAKFSEVDRKYNVQFNCTPATSVTLNVTRGGQPLTLTTSTPSSELYLLYGDEFSVTYTTPSGYEFNSISVSGTTKNSNRYTVNGSGSVKITLKHQRITHAVRFMVEGSELVSSAKFIEDGERLSESLLPTAPTKNATVAVKYIFEGWSLTEGGEVIQDFSNIVVNEDIALYAVFSEEKIKYSVTFSYSPVAHIVLNVTRGGGLYTITTDSQTSERFVYYGEEFNVLVTPSVGYDVSGITVNGATENSNKYTVNGNVTVNVTQTKTVCSVSFMVGGEIYATRNVNYGDKVTNLPANPTKAEENEQIFTFSHWSLTEDGDEVDVTNYTIQSKDVRFYAVFDMEYIKHVSVHIDNQTVDCYMPVGGNLSEELEKVLVAEELEINNNNSIGWYLDEDFNSPLTDTTVVTRGATLYTRMATLDKIIIDEEFNVTAVSKDITGEVVLPACVVALPEKAFNECMSMTSIFISDNVTDFGKMAFRRCETLSNIAFTPNSKLKRIGSSVFNICKSLMELTIPASVTAIGSTCFTGANGIVISFADGSQLESFGSIFDSCFAVYGIKFLGSTKMKVIEYDAFNSCKNLKEIILPEGIESIEDYAFNYCTSLTEITIPASVETIYAGAFSNCTALEVVNISSNSLLHTIDESAFSGCNKLTSFYVPKLVTTIGDFAFYYCKGLEEFVVDAENEYFASQDGVLFNKAKTTLLIYPCKKTGTSYSVPNTVETIETYAFMHSTLEYIYFPASVKTIKEKVFLNCTALQNAEFENFYWIIDETSQYLNIPSTNATYFKSTYRDFVWRIAEIVNINIVIRGETQTCQFREGESVDYALSTLWRNGDFIIAEGFDIENLSTEWFFDSNYSQPVCSDIIIGETTVYYLAWGKQETPYGLIIEDGVVVGTSYTGPKGEIVIPYGVTAIADNAFNCWEITQIYIPYTVTSIGGGFLTRDSNKSCTCSGIHIKANEYYKSIDGVLYNGDVTTLLCYPDNNPQSIYYMPTTVTSIAESGRIALNSNLNEIYLSPNLSDAQYIEFATLANLTHIGIIGDSQYYSSDNGVLYTKDYLELIFYPMSKEDVVYEIDSRTVKIRENAFLNCPYWLEIVIPSSVQYIDRYAMSGCNDKISVIFFSDSVDWILSTDPEFTETIEISGAELAADPWQAATTYFTYIGYYWKAKTE